MNWLMKWLSIFLKFLFGTMFTLALLGAFALAGAYLYLSPHLPPTDSLRHVQFQVPLRVYSNTGSLLAEFGEKRRIPLDYKDVPEPMIQAFLAVPRVRTSSDAWRPTD